MCVIPGRGCMCGVVGLWRTDAVLLVPMCGVLDEVVWNR